jgi:hypothetical protein
LFAYSILTLLPFLKIFRNLTALFFFFLFLSSCSEDSEVPEDPIELPQIIEKEEISSEKPVSKPEFPVVYIEELDQFQEYFKEQHETSFSHVPNKNWMSFTAGKDGVLTKILLFGKANYQVSEHYGSGMRGFVRESNPKKGPRLGEWELTRDEIVNQLAAQGLNETQAGWITIRMRGNIPQESGKTYFLICKEIDDGKPWFGAFSFSEGNSYLPGRHWLHPDHDLVFRSYVGKTSEQIAKEQKSAANFQPAQPKTTENISTSPVLQPPPPKPMIDKNPSVGLPVEYKPAVEVDPTRITPPLLPPEKNSTVPENDKKELENKSLFDRLFKKSSTKDK